MDPESTKAKILIVDDTAEYIDILMDLLRDDYRLVPARSGKAALKIAASKNPPDLILLDIMMPEMDGYEVCKILKTQDHTKDIPVHFLTAKNDESDEIKGLNLGAADYITKPFSPLIVKARVENHLELKRARQQLKEQNKELLDAAQLQEDIELIIRHDLKTPLNAIIAFPDIILNKLELKPECAKYLEVIRESGLKMLYMINLSLDLVKMERGRYELSPEPVNIISLINKILKETERLVRVKQISTQLLVNGLAVADESFFIQGEELLCYSMLANLINNAIEACPESGNITIYLDNRETPEIKIRNEGEVPEKIRDTFFEKYVTAGKGGGTGLGTYSAKLIATTLKGEISLDSSEENYTSVLIRLSQE